MSLITENDPHDLTHALPATVRKPLVRTDKPGPLLRGLLAEWDAACNSTRVLRRVNSWGLPGSHVEHLDDIVRRAGFGGAHDCDDADSYLLALVSRAANDPLAARIVLQRILPPVISIAQRRGRLHSSGIEGAIGDLVTQAWFVISTYPVERRPRKVAANIVRDIEYHEYVAANRPRKTRVQFVDHDNFASASFGHARRETAAPPEDDEVRNLLLEMEIHGVSTVRREIIELSCAGWKCTEIGRHLGMPERTVRWHRSEALKTAASFVEEFRPLSATSDGPLLGGAA